MQDADGAADAEAHEALCRVQVAQRHGEVHDERAGAAVLALLHLHDAKVGVLHGHVVAGLPDARWAGHKASAICAPALQGHQRCNGTIRHMPSLYSLTAGKSLRYDDAGATLHDCRGSRDFSFYGGGRSAGHRLGCKPRDALLAAVRHLGPRR
eukprot:scaffold2506_cov236-Pinguiococcus_pyrenoidosus.AAC.4